MIPYIVTFHSHFSAISFYRAVKDQYITARLMPIPRHLSSSCGTCVSLDWPLDKEEMLWQYDGVEGVFSQNQQ